MAHDERPRAESRVVENLAYGVALLLVILAPALFVDALHADRPHADLIKVISGPGTLIGAGMLVWLYGRRGKGG